MTDWSFAPIFDSYALVATVVGALALLALIGPNFGHTSKPRRWTLVALRWLIVALFSLALLRPTCVHTTTRMQRSSLLILVDQSRSMQLPHATGDQSRWEAQKRAFQAAQTVLGEMADRIDVKWFAYDERLQTLEGTGGFPTLADKPGGAQTDIGSSLSAAVRQELGKRLAGVIVSGDGVQTAYEPSVELHDAARELERLGYPLYTLVFGPPGSAAQSRDVALESLPDQYTVFVKNELAVRGVVRVHGYVNQEVPVELVIEDASGKQRKLGARQVVAREDGQQLEAAFSFTPDEVGRYKLTMSAAVQPGELVTKNNQLTSYLTVLEGGLKILYLDGKLLHEQRFLSRALDSSPDMSLDFQWFDSRQRDKWPVTLNQPLDASQYDVFILGDLDSSALGERNLSQLARAVQRGKGLIMLGGQHSFGPGGYQNSPLADVLPIKIDRLERQDFGQPPRADLHLSGALAMLPARDHPVLRLAPPAENAGRWQSLPPLDGANKFVDLKDAPGVQLLAETPKHEPLLVAGEYGQGRVLAFAGDSTWRWAMRGRQADHKRFWRQVVLWLARRDDSTQNDVWLKLSQRRFPPGAKIAFTAGARSASGEAIAEAVLKAKLIGPGGSESPVKIARDKLDWAGTLDGVREPGDYRIELEATADGKLLGTARAEFQVFDQDLELATPAADHDQMARLAEITREFGGRAVAPEDLAQLLRDLHAASQELQVQVQSRWQLGDSPLDAWLFFLALLAVLTVEWALRKKWGLV